MKKYIYGLFLALVSVAMFTACSDDEGSNPGSDSQAKVTLYQYAATAPNDADVDTQIRIATNSATQSAYLLVEKTADYESRVAELGEEGYKDYVVEHGEKVEGAEGAANVDKTIKNLSGDNTIAVVAVGKNKALATVQFTANSWTTVAEGTYNFTGVGASLFGASTAATLQVNDADSKSFRFKDFWGTGKHLTFNLTDKKGQDDDGLTITQLVVPEQATPFTHPSYGTIFCADALTHRTVNEASYMYDDYYCMIAMQWYVSAGNLAQITGYDSFVPNE